jgi:hypothetical protein
MSVDETSSSSRIERTLCASTCHTMSSVVGEKAIAITPIMHGKHKPSQEDRLSRHMDVASSPPTTTADVQTQNSWPPHVPAGIKRHVAAISAHQLNSRIRQSKKSKSNDVSEITTQMIQRMDPTISAIDADLILRDYNYARKLMKQQNESIIPSTPSVEYMIGLINEWKPKSEIICMYVRWSKRLRRNFHLDSVSTLLCVSKQCDYKPHVFLKKVKTLTVCQSTTTYGINFKFGTSRNTGTEGTKLNNQFLGLSITLRLLQRGIVSNCGTMGSIGLKTHKKGKTEFNDDVYLSQDIMQHNQTAVASKPTSRFHTNTGLIGRIWLAIEHRWISIQVVEMLFESQLAYALNEQESLAVSFQIHSASGPTRYDFLDPLIGVCLRFRLTSIINNHKTTLQSVWDNPKMFVSFGNAHLQGVSRDDIEQIIAENFNSLKESMKTRGKMTLHPKTEREVKWQMIRGYAFHFWLDSTKNEALKDAVDRRCRHSQHAPSGTSTKIKSHNSLKINNTPNYGNPRVSKDEMNEKEKSVDAYNQDHTSFTRLTSSGLSQLISTRQVDQRNTLPEHNTPFHENTVTSYETSTSVTSVRSSVLAWNTIRLSRLCELRSRVSSCLLVHRDDGVVLLSELAPLEVYSADMLYKLRHSRWTGRAGESPIASCGSLRFSIDAVVDKYIDRYANVLHVAREDCNYFQDHETLIPSIEHLGNLCQAILKYGKIDTTRSNDQSRINIGCGGQHKPTGVPEVLIGLSFKDSLVADPVFDSDEILSTIGMMTEFTWNVLNDMQSDANAIQLAPDTTRKDKYARHLAKYLKAKEEVGFEDITVVVSMLYPSMPQVDTHVDCMNDSIAGYTRTGVFNVVLSLGEGINMILLHLQVLCNFRRVIREHLFPFRGFLLSIEDHCRVYLTKLQRNINSIYGGRTTHLPVPFDRSNFFVDDSLPFTTIAICSNVDGPRITGKYLLTEINPSRVLSFSMFIDPIRDLNEILCFDQQIELCFVASVLSNPFWFEYILAHLKKKHLSKTDSFIFDIHPLFDWSKETFAVFGSWQGGPHNRWSPFGGSTPFPDLFGAHVQATDLDKKSGCTKLKSIIEILLKHLQWIDSLDGEVEDLLNDLPIPMVSQHMKSVTDAIYKIVPCQFSVFRLMVFTTIAIGCGMVKPGVHLKGITFPVKGSASYKHLMNPNQDHISHEEALRMCSITTS